MVDLDPLFSPFKAAWVSRISKADPENDNWVLIPMLFTFTVQGMC